MREDFTLTYERIIKRHCKYINKKCYSTKPEKSFLKTCYNFIIFSTKMFENLRNIPNKKFTHSLCLQKFNNFKKGYLGLCQKNGDI